MTENDKTTFTQSPLFSKFDIKYYEKLIKNKEAKIASFKKGEVILDGKSNERCLILILKGSASVSKLSVDGKKAIINFLYRGDVFGMATLFYEYDEFPTTVTAEEACRTAILPKEVVENAFASSPEFAKEYVTLLSKKIHFLNQRISTFAESESDEKLLNWLEKNSGGKNEFELPCSISKLAFVLNIGRASVYRAFDSLSEEGYIAKDGKKITLLKK